MIAVIIPTYNERENIVPIITSIKKNLPKAKIIVVDDTSPDGTANLVKKIKNIHLIVNKKKLGLGKAYLIGMDYAINKLNANILIEIDADLSHDPRELPKLIELIKNNDLVLGSRYIKGGSIPKEWPFYRKFLSTAGNLFIRLMLGRKIKDWSTGYRAIKAEVYKNIRNEIDKEMFYGYTFQIGFLYKAMKKGYKIAETPIHFKDRKKGKSKLGPDFLFNTFLYILKVKLNI
ncbi:MAG: polyprenol monophosphomannose synthase [Nanoarchaeota archaeon]|mgnify:CR=1 FL=1